MEGAEGGGGGEEGGGTMEGDSYCGWSVIMGAKRGGERRKKEGEGEGVEKVPLSE